MLHVLNSFHTLFRDYTTYLKYPLIDSLNYLLAGLNNYVITGFGYKTEGLNLIIDSGVAVVNGNLVFSDSLHTISCANITQEMIVSLYVYNEPSQKVAGFYMASSSNWYNDLQLYLYKVRKQGNTLIVKDLRSYHPDSLYTELYATNPNDIIFPGNGYKYLIVLSSVSDIREEYKNGYFKPTYRGLYFVHLYFGAKSFNPESGNGTLFVRIGDTYFPVSGIAFPINEISYHYANFFYFLDWSEQLSLWVSAGCHMAENLGFPANSFHLRIWGFRMKHPFYPSPP